MLNDDILRWCKGNQDAQQLCLKLWTALEEWDDLEDEGRCENMNRLLSWLSFGKEYDPFFIQHSHILRPVFLTLYLQWRASNVLDRGNRLDVAKSYMLRAGYYTFIHAVVWIVGGDDWAAEVGPEIYRAYGETPDEIWEEFNG